MGLFDRLRSEFIDVIQWIDDSQDTMVYRFERKGNAIKNGAQLTVRESQEAVFVHEGQLADVFPPGRYTLTTNNIPILTSLESWKYGFDSPFVSEVYFVNTKVFTNRKWGTPSAFYIRDQDFGRVSLRAFGTYSMRICDSKKFLEKISGTNGDFSADQINDELRSLIVTRFIDAIGESKLSLLDFAQNYKDLSDFCQQKLGTEFLEYGLEITKFLISSINLPEELQKRLDEGTGMNMLGDMNRYQQMKSAEAMASAASNPGAGGGMEGMAGMMMMQNMMNQQQMMNQQMMNNQMMNNQMNQQAAPPPPPMSSQYYVSVNGQQQGPFAMQVLAQMVANGQLTANTYVWKQGMASWALASQVAEVAALFNQAAPPPPPPPAM